MSGDRLTFHVMSFSGVSLVNGSLADVRGWLNQGRPKSAPAPVELPGWYVDWDGNEQAPVVLVSYGPTELILMKGNVARSLLVQIAAL